MPFFGAGGNTIRGVVYRLIESLASMGHSSIWKLICAISVCNTLTVGVHLSSTPSISGPGSATVESIGCTGDIQFTSRSKGRHTYVIT